MKRYFQLSTLAIIIIVGIGFSSCVKKNCDEMMVGKLVVLEEPYEYQNWCNKKYYKIVAHFFIDDIPDSLILGNTTYNSYPHFKICGYIPNKYQKAGVYDITASLKPHHPCGHIQEAQVPLDADPNGDWHIYKVSCIEQK